MKLVEHNRVQLIWIPAHRKISENGSTEQLARSGFAYTSVGSDSVCVSQKGLLIGTENTRNAGSPHV
jgi:ribonuclease HI